MLDPEVFAKLAFECAALVSEHVPAGLEHAPDGRVDLFGQHFILRDDVASMNHCTDSTK